MKDHCRVSGPVHVVEGREVVDKAIQQKGVYSLTVLQTMWV